MNSQSLIVIVIPTYNRAHLIGQTLDSILAQTYWNWECIVVDDGSNDYTDELLTFYAEKDARIQYFHRPKNRPKGANVCRNYGFELGKGEYIIWFDSDDLMTHNHLEVKLNSLVKSKKDFVIGKTQNFSSKGFQNTYQYESDLKKINLENYILRKIHWYTYDVIIIRALAEKITFNEQMKSWQDYNYFCKMLVESTSCIFLDEVLTHRRIHECSIQAKMMGSPVIFNAQLLEALLLTYEDVSAQINSYTRKELTRNLMNLCFDLAKLNRINKNTVKVFFKVKKTFGIKGVCYFISSLFSGLILNKGDFILNKAKCKN